MFEESLFMTECSKCGKEDMGFKCRYCGEKFCSEHRLPEKHECSDLDKAIEKEKKQDDKWFQEKEVRNTPPPKKNKPSLIKDILRTFKNNYTLAIILFTTLVYLVQLSTGSSPSQNPVYDLFALQSDPSELLTSPWSIFTVMFLHGSTFHLFANMITLYFFGTALERLIGSKDFLKFYFASGIIASIGFVVFRNFISLYQGAEVLGPAVGASGAVVAVFAAVAMLYPRADVLLFFVIPMKIKTGLYAFAAFESFNLTMALLGFQFWPFASSAHLTGLIVGVYLGKKLQNKYGGRNHGFNPLEV